MRVLGCVSGRAEKHPTLLRPVPEATRDDDLWKVVLVSWCIAFFEYCFQVPANRLGHGRFSAAELKTIQEIITLLVFCVFSILYLHEGVKWNYLVGFALIVGAAFFIFHKW